MPEMHLRQPRVTYSVCRPFAKKTKTEYKNLKKQEMRFTLYLSKQNRYSMLSRYGFWKF